MQPGLHGATQATRENPSLPKRLIRVEPLKLVRHPLAPPGPGPRGTDSRTGEAIAIRRALCQDGETRRAAREEIGLLEGLPPHQHIVRFLGGEIVEVGARAGASGVFGASAGLCLSCRRSVGRRAVGRLVAPQIDPGRPKPDSRSTLFQFWGIPLTIRKS